MSRRYFYFTVFVAGMSTLATEFVVSRMLQTVYGTSNIVWANVIGLTLLFLTAGYFIGGRLADNYPEERYFYLLVTIAGICVIFFLLLTSYVLKSAASALAALDVGAIVGSLALVIFALALPITLLGCISPFAIRLAVKEVTEAGRISGRIYAISTWGSLLGTYLPALFIIPLAGTRLAALIFGTLLLLVGLYGLWRVSPQRLKFLALPLILLYARGVGWATGPIKSYPNQIFETESAYNYIQVIRQEDCNYLLLNEGQAYHSFYCDNNRIPRISVWSVMLAAPYFNVEPKAPQSAAVIGLAAGTIPKQFSSVFGAIPIAGIELDGEIVQVGHDYFALTEPNIDVIIGDGRYELNQLSNQYDLITLDAYKVPYIPWHLTTQDFFGEVAERLTPNGVVAINVGRVPADRRLVEAMTATLLTVFPSVHAIDVPGALNTILVATMQPTDGANLPRNLAAMPADAHPLLEAALNVAVENIVPTQTGDNILFSDERAPVETIIDSLVIRYMLSEGVGGLPALE